MFKQPEYNVEAVKEKLERELKLDAGFSAFIANELKEVDSRLFDIKYAELEALKFLPVNGRISVGAETISYKQYDGRGMAQITSDYATASPSNDIVAAEYFMGITGIRTSVTFSIQEMRAASMAGVPLEMKKMEQARRTIAEGIDKVALNGNAATNSIGFFSIPNVPTAAAADQWDLASALTPDQIALAIIEFVNSVWVTSKGVHRANRLILPALLKLELESRRLGSVNDTSILDYVKSRLPGVEVMASFQLSDKAIAYEYSADNLELVLPVAFEAFPEEVHATRVVREMHARVGGVRAFYPLSLAYKTDIQT